MLMRPFVAFISLMCFDCHQHFKNNAESIDDAKVDLFTYLFFFRLPQGTPEMIQQRKLLYMGLFLLIWGEAANVRFLPECLCYIFHNVYTNLSQSPNSLVSARNVFIVLPNVS